MRALFPAAFALALVGCGSSDDDGATAEVERPGAFGHISFRSEPEGELVEGVNAFRVELARLDTREPLPGCHLEAEAVMPSMGHASQEDAVIVEVGTGVYRVDGIVFTMPGTWEVRYRAMSGDVLDEAAFTYDVR